MPDVVLRAEHVTKRFGGITALENAELELYKGEVHALVGANGAGKSTLIKIITGAYPKDEGDIYLEGRAYAHPWWMRKSCPRLKSLI